MTKQRERVSPRSPFCILIAMRMVAAVIGLLCVASLCAHAQGGPPLFTDDPGTPGNKNWEINVGATTDRRLGVHDDEVPQLDVNYGLGNRIQLNYQVPWLLHSSQTDVTSKSGLGNSQFAVKWRFFENDRHELQLSTYPRLEVNNPNDSVARGLADRGTAFLLPLELTKRVGPVEVNGEVGHWFQQYEPDRWIFGLAVGRQVTERLELLAEYYHIKSSDAAARDETLDGGGRLKLKGPFVLLFMAGRSLRRGSSGQSQFVGYLGVQLLLPPPKQIAPETGARKHETTGPK